MLPASVLAPLAIAIAVQTIPTFSNLAATTLAPRILADLGLPGALANGHVFVVYGTATVVSFVAASFVLRSGPIGSSQISLFAMAAGGLGIFVEPALASFVVCALLYGAAYVTPIPAGAQILVEHTPAHLRNTLFGIRQIGVPLGGLLAGAIYPAVAEAYGWQAAFGMTAALCALLAVAIHPARRRFDRGKRPGAPLFRASGQSPVAVLKASPTMRRLGLAAICFAGTEVAAVANMVLYLEGHLGWTLVHAGYALAVLSVGGVLGRLFWGVVADRLERRIQLLGALGLGMAASMAALAFLSAEAAIYAHAAAFCVGFTAGGWTGVGVAEGARLAGAAGAVAGTAALTQAMFVGVVALPFLVGVGLAAGLAYPVVLASIGALAGVGGLLLLTAPPET